MSDNPRVPRSAPAARPIGGGPARRKWLLPLILALVVLIALLLLLSQCGGDDDEPTSGTPTTAATSALPTATTATASATSTASAGAAAAGTVTAAGADLLSAPQNLSASDGQPAVAQGVKVQSVPADEGFWVGSSEQDRLWVQLSGTGGESTYKVKEGDTVNFTGTVARAAGDFTAKAGLTAAEGADQLTEQGFYISVPASSVKLS